MSQAGRGLNGGIDYVFNFLRVLDYISNGNASFYVNAYGDLICHSLQIATSLTVNTLTVIGGLIAPSFSNPDGTFTVDSFGILTATDLFVSSMSVSISEAITALETFKADKIWVEDNFLTISDAASVYATIAWVQNDSTGFFKTVKDWVTANFEPTLDLTNIICETINTSAPVLSINDTLTNAITYIKGRVGINIANPVTGSSLHVYGVTTLEGDVHIRGNCVITRPDTAPDNDFRINFGGTGIWNKVMEIQYTLAQQGDLLSKAIDNIGSHTLFAPPSLLQRTDTLSAAVTTINNNITRIDNNIGTTAALTTSLLTSISNLNNSITNLNKWTLVGAAYVQWDGSLWQVSYLSDEVSINFEYYGTGWHFIECFSSKFASRSPQMAFLQVQQITTTGTNGTFKINLLGVTSTSATWSLETFNLGASRTRCGFQLLIW